MSATVTTRFFPLKAIFAAAILPALFLMGCLRPFESPDSGQPVNDRLLAFRKLKVGITYDEVVALMGPPGDYTTVRTYYNVHDTHTYGPVDRYWTDDWQNIELFFDDDDKLTAKILHPAF